MMNYRVNPIYLLFNIRL